MVESAGVEICRSAASMPNRSQFLDVVRLAQRRVVGQERVADAQPAQPIQERQRHVEQPLASIERAVHVQHDVADPRQGIRPALALDGHDSPLPGTRRPPGPNSSSSAESMTPSRIAKSRTVKRRRM